MVNSMLYSPPPPPPPVKSLRAFCFVMCGNHRIIVNGHQHKSGNGGCASWWLWGLVARGGGGGGGGAAYQLGTGLSCSGHPASDVHSPLVSNIIYILEVKVHSDAHYSAIFPPTKVYCCSMLVFQSRVREEQ